MSARQIRRLPPKPHRWLAIGLYLLASGAATQTAPERPRPSVNPVAPAGPTEAEKRAEKKAAAQRAEDKRATDRVIAEALAQAEREHQAREKLEADRRAAETQAERERLAREKVEADKRLAEAQAERERLAREKLEADNRRLETERLDLERKLRMAELAKPVPAQVVPTPAVPPVKLATPVARHPLAGDRLFAKQTFVDSWGRGSTRDSAPRMVVIAPTTAAGFLMGSPGHENGRSANEKQHRVSINYAFALSETEITLEQWDACVADGGCGNTRIGWGWDRGRAQYPVVHVSWHHARAYADWLNRRLRMARDDAYRYRLPSEAEWEYAARADSSGPFGFAQNRNIAPDLANYDTRVAYQGSQTREWTRDTRPVGSYPANAFGIRDMHGNVWEWVADCFEPDYDKTPRNGAAHREFDGTCPFRVVRGGSWSISPDDLRTASRLWAPPAYHDNRGGFRLARMLPPPD